MGMVRHDIGLAETKNRFPLKGTCLGIYSRVLNTRDPLERVLQDIYPWCSQWESELKKLFGAYVEAKQQQNVLDYDDLLLFWAEMMAEPQLAQEVGERFDHLLVDEYQDTNRLQSEIILAHEADAAQGVTVVGDDAQSIYSFRGATVRNILDFPHQFTQPARIVTLERNYRSTQPILDASNAVIGAGARAPRQEPVDRQGLQPHARSCCWCPTRPRRRAGWPTRCCASAKPAARSRARRCCFAPAPTAPRSSSSWRAATSPS